MRLRQCGFVASGLANIQTTAGEPCSMSRNTHYMYHQPPDMFSRQVLELTFRLLRNNNPELAFALKKTIDNIHFAPPEATLGSHTGEMHLNTDVVRLLGAETVGKIVSALTDIGTHAVAKKDLPPQHIKILRGLIEDWAVFAEWILQHATSEKSAFH